MRLRRRSAYDLYCSHDITARRVALILGQSEETFRRGLAREGLPLEKAARDGPLQAAGRIMALLHDELSRLATISDGLSSKARLDALASLARTIDRVHDLKDRFVEQARPAEGLAPEELRAALVRIDERIDDLANIRAEELVRRQSQPAADTAGGAGMAAEGAAGPAAAGA